MTLFFHRFYQSTHSECGPVQNKKEISWKKTVLLLLLAFGCTIGIFLCFVELIPTDESVSLQFPGPLGHSKILMAPVPEKDGLPSRNLLDIKLQHQATHDGKAELQLQSIIATLAKHTAMNSKMTSNLRFKNNHPVASSENAQSLTLELSELTSSQGVSFEAVGFTGSCSTGNAGDFNGDGYDDLITGVCQNSTVFVVFGGAELPGTIDLDNLSPKQGLRFIGDDDDYSGYSVSGAGDFNGDGIDDIIIGAPNGPGAAFVVFGNKSFVSNVIYLHTMTPEQGVTIEGSYAYEFLGFSVSGAGDFNNDTFADVVIGAPFGNINAGISYVIFGAHTPSAIIILSDLTPDQGISIKGSIGDFCGWSVSGAGDFSNDGIDDVIVGAPLANAAAGMVYVIYGSANPSNINTSTFLYSQGLSIYGQEGQTGYSVSAAGDFNNDNFDDIIIGAPYADFGLGVSYVIYGDDYIDNNNASYSLYLTSMSPYVGVAIVGAQGASGSAVSGAGDVNGDNYDDVIISAPYAGLTYVIYGVYGYPGTLSLSNMEQSTGFSIAGNTFTLSGPSISGAGNFSGGIYADIIIGAYGGSFCASAIYGSSSGFVTPSPIAAPSLSPTTAPHIKNASWKPPDGSNFRAVISVAFSIAFSIAAYFFRNNIAFYILDHWGHRYKLMFDGEKTFLEEGEIGIRLDNDTVMCVVKGNNFKLHTDSNNAGVTEGLYNSLKRILTYPDIFIFKSFTLTKNEENQLRDFLFNHSYIETKKWCWCVPCYPELGYIRGTIYRLILANFEEAHKAISKKQIHRASEMELSSADWPKLLVQATRNNVLVNPLVLGGRSSTERNSTPSGPIRNSTPFAVGVPSNNVAEDENNNL